jgi:hypothetical protein
MTAEFLCTHATINYKLSSRHSRGFGQNFHSMSMVANPCKSGQICVRRSHGCLYLGPVCVVNNTKHVAYHGRIIHAPNLFAARCVECETNARTKPALSLCVSHPALRVFVVFMRAENNRAAPQRSKDYRTSRAGRRARA